MSEQPDKDKDIPPGARRAIRYIELIQTYPVWGFRDVEVEELIRPQRISVVDLAGADRTIAAYVADKALREIWARATTGQLPYPLFVVLEEAHNLVPAERQGFASRASRIINTVASEGRKFKVFLVVVSQRPSKISQDTLSQCGSQIIMQLTNPEDQKAVRQASEALSEDLLANLPGLNTGEAIVLGQLTRVPAMIRVGERLSAEGGADVDLVATLRRARDDARTQAYVQVQRPPVVERQQEEWL
jgi:DNA helicase HerA-like ATPase